MLSISLSLAAARDPTLAPDSELRAPAAERGGLQLQGIVRGSHGLRAVINGQSLRVGSRIGQARLTAIRARSVLLERQGRQEELHLVQPIVKPSR